MQTDIESFDTTLTAPRVAEPHPLCAMIRNLRRAAGLSLTTFENQTGIPAVVVGAYERGDRIPPLPKLEAILRAFGYRITAVPEGSAAVRLSGDMVSDLRAIADQLEAKRSLSQLPHGDVDDDE